MIDSFLTMIKNLVKTLIVIFPMNLMALPGDDLVVISNIINMRDGPSKEHSIVLKLQKGRKLIEIQRAEGWVEVDTGRKDVKTGWVYAPLLQLIVVKNREIDKQNTASKPEFEKFKIAFNDLNTDLNKLRGFECFTKTEELGNRTIQVTASEGWLGLSRVEREDTLTSIFNLWSDVVGIGTSITILVVDKQGDRFMTMLR